MIKYYKRFQPSAIIIFAAGLLLASISVQAARTNKADKGLPWYEVEVIVFANKKQLGLATETWPEGTPPSNSSDVIDLAIYNEIPYTTVQPPVIEDEPKRKRKKQIEEAESDYMGPKPASTAIYRDGAYVLLGRQHYQLGQIAQSIANSNQYELLLHIVWRQPTYDKSHSIPVFVFQGMQNPDRLVRTNTSNPNMALETMPVGPHYHQLSGTLRLSVSRYLHLEADLHYKIPMLQEELVYDTESASGGFGSFFGASSTPIAIEREVVRDFRLFESRRMRSKEIHYYDHPMLGVVSRVTPYEAPSEPEFVAPKSKAKTTKGSKTKPRR